MELDTVPNTEATDHIATIQSILATGRTEDTINVAVAIKSVEENIFPSYYNETDLKNGVDILNELGQVVVEEYKIDEDSRKEWYDSAVEVMRMFKSYMEPKNDPWPGCSNVNMPFITVASLQFHSRAYEALIPAKGVVQVLDTKIAGAVDHPEALAAAQRASRVEHHMNYQLLYEMEEFEPDTDSMLMELPNTGCSFKKTYYDQVLNRCVSGYVSSFDVVFNYGFKNVEEAQRVSHILYVYSNDIRKRVQAKVYLDDAWDLGPGTSYNVLERKTSDLDRMDGLQKPSSTSNAPRVLIEQHRYCDFNNDGIAEPYIVTVDFETQKVIRIVDRRTKDVIGNTIETSYFTQYNFLPNPSGGYGLGMGTLLKGLNKAGNTILNEIIDAGALANIQGGFVTKRSGVKKGSLSFNMGEFKEVDTYVDDIRKAVYHLEFKGPNNTLYAVLGLLYEYAKLVSSVSETMTGQLPASDTPASTVLALLEEGRKVFSSIHKRIHRSFKRELKKIQKLNSLHLDSRKYFQVLVGGVPKGDIESIGKQDYAASLDVIPVSDPTIISRAEKVIKAEKTREIVLTDPISSRNQANIFEATKRLFESYDVSDIDAIYSAPTQPPPPPDIPPEQENALFIQGQDSKVLPTQDHERHLTIHEELVKGPYMHSVQKNGKRILTDHIQQHLAGMYLADKQAQMQKQKQMQMQMQAQSQSQGNPNVSA